MAFSVASPFSVVASQHKVANFITFSSPVVSTTFILFSVKVPVLSEHITVALPKASTEERVFTMALFFAIV